MLYSLKHIYMNMITSCDSLIQLSKDLLNIIFF